MESFGKSAWKEMNKYSEKRFKNMEQRDRGSNVRKPIGLSQINRQKPVKIWIFRSRNICCEIHYPRST